MLRSIEQIGGGLCIAAILAATAFAQGGSGPQRPDRRSAAPSYDRSAGPARPTVLTPHCGQYLTKDEQYYELVLTMVQARIYVYDKSLKPQTARSLRVQISLQVPGEREIRRIPFQYAPLPAGAVEQDCVVANFDFAQLGDKEVPLKIAFFDSPTRSQPTASFTPLFTKDAIRPYVAQVLLTEADRATVLQQRVCPVSGDVLGTKGRIVKLLVGEVPVYLCSKECIQAVRQTPDQYLPRPAAAPGNPIPAPSGAPTGNR